MLIPQSDRKKIFEHLFEDGVCIAKKDYNLKSHSEIKGVRNLYVIKALKYAWRHYYFYLKEEGVPYLREYLGLPEDVLPNTHKQRLEPSRVTYPDKMGGGGAGRGFRGGDDRGAYRTTDKQADAGPGSMPVRQGFGRGGGMPTSVPTPPPQEPQGVEDGGNFATGDSGW
uniref:S10_plectin domain-containing protein n=1 Tax=Meloidogyne hapla TaxID=6305 RepID=A0A1I8AZT8_MELHA